MSAVSVYYYDALRYHIYVYAMRGLLRCSFLDKWVMRRPSVAWTSKMRTPTLFCSLFLIGRLET